MYQVQGKLNNERACRQGWIEGALCLLKVMMMMMMIIAVEKSALETVEQCADIMERSRGSVNDITRQEVSVVVEIINCQDNLRLLYNNDIGAIFAI
jgi:hypothetical protein